MADRVDRTAAVAGVDDLGRDLIAKAMAAAMAPRLAAIDDDHHPDYLRIPTNRRASESQEYTVNPMSEQKQTKPVKHVTPEQKQMSQKVLRVK